MCANKLLCIQTTQTYPFKVVFESLKDILGDVPWTITPGDGKDKLEDSDDERGSKKKKKQESSDEESEEEPPKKTKKKQQLVSEDEESEEDATPKKKGKKQSSSEEEEESEEEQPKKVVKKSVKGKKGKDTVKVKNTNIKVMPKKKKGRPKKSEQIKSIRKKNQDNVMNDDAPMKGGIKIVAVNSSKSVLVFVKLPAKNFNKFVCKRKVLTIGLTLPHLHKFIKTVEKEATLMLYMDEDDMSHLGIRIDNKNKNKVANYTLNLLDLPKNELEFERAEFESYIRMPSADFQQTCKNMHVISEYVEIKSIGKQLSFMCEGDIGTHQEIYGKTEKGLKMNGDKDIVQGIYELKHLVSFTKCTPVSDMIEIYMRNDYPLIIKYSIPTLGVVYFCVSPVLNDKIDEDKVKDV